MRMKSLLILLIFLTPLLAGATEGACSYHGGVQCGIGPIGGRAVCNDGWISSVYYHNMVECEGFLDSCVSYLSENAYTYNRSQIKAELDVLNIEIENLKNDLEFDLYYQREKEKLEVQESFKGRGATTAGIQPHLNAVDRKYDRMELETEREYRDKISEYNSLVEKYNGICRSYTYEDRDKVCKLNYGESSKYNGQQKTCSQLVTSTVNILTITPTEKLETKTPDELCQLSENNPEAWYNETTYKCVACPEGLEHIQGTYKCVSPEQVNSTAQQDTQNKIPPSSTPTSKLEEKAETNEYMRANVSQIDLQITEEKEEVKSGSVENTKISTFTPELQEDTLQKESEEIEKEEISIVKRVTNWIGNFFRNLF
jgi:hypothetical protein